MNAFTRYLTQALLCTATCLSVLTFAADDAAPEAAQTQAAELGPDGVQRATLILDSYSFTPSHLIVKRGVPVELILKNAAGITPHDWVLDAPDAALQIKSDVKAGETASVKFTPMQTGEFEFFCDKKLLLFKSHREKGMKGVLEVQ